MSVESSIILFAISCAVAFDENRKFKDKMQYAILVSLYIAYVMISGGQ